MINSNQLQYLLELPIAFFVFGLKEEPQDLNEFGQVRVTRTWFEKSIGVCQFSDLNVPILQAEFSSPAESS